MQDPKNLTIVTCDVCGHRINPKTRYIRLQLHTLWSGPVGLGIHICAGCAVGKLGICADAMKHPASVTSEK